MSIDAIEHVLYHRSGLLGLSGISGDMRSLLASDNADARAAVEQFCARVAEQIAVMAASLRGFKLLIFTGGIGENSPDVRSRIFARLGWLGLSLDNSASLLKNSYLYQLVKSNMKCRPWAPF
jgi:acetate kinase